MGSVPILLWLNWAEWISVLTIRLGVDAAGIDAAITGCALRMTIK
jgi:hypothetical protein